MTSEQRMAAMRDEKLESNFKNWNVSEPSDHPTPQGG